MIQETTAAVVLNAWDNFYVIVGSSAAALTGLMFVVIALVADRRFEGSPSDVATFGTPTVLHFCSVLLISAVVSAPWRTLASPGLVLGVAAFGGLGYVTIVTLRAGRSTAYQPVFEDWVFHVFLPLLSYASLLVGSVILPRFPTQAMFLIGAVSVVLLFDGIHNSWDTVTWIALRNVKS